MATLFYNYSLDHGGHVVARGHHAPFGEGEQGEVLFERTAVARNLHVLETRHLNGEIQTEEAKAN